MKRFLKSLLASFQNRQGRRDLLNTRPVLEALEDRLTPAVTWSVGDFNNDGFRDLRVEGGAENTRVLLTEQAGDELQLSLDINGDGFYFGLGEFLNRPLEANDDFSVEHGTVDVVLGDGTDRVSYTLSNGNLDGVTRKLSIDLGSGNDVFTMFRANSGITDGTELTIEIKARGGDDTITFATGSGTTTDGIVDDARFVVRADLGADDDIFDVDLENTSGPSVSPSLDHGAVVRFDVRGGEGENDVTLSLDAVGPTEKSTFRFDYKGGNDNAGDLVEYDLYGDISNRSQVRLGGKLRGGDDTFDFTALPSTFEINGRKSALRLAVDGGAGNDVLRAEDQHLAGSYTFDVEGKFDVQLKGGAGDDRLRFAFASDAQFDLANHALVQVRLLGGAGEDLLGDDGSYVGPVTLSNTASSTGKYNVVLNAGADDDTVNLDVNNPSDDVKYGPNGKLRQDGGSGTDLLVSDPQADVVDRHFESFSQ